VLCVCLWPAQHCYDKRADATAPLTKTDVVVALLVGTARQVVRVPAECDNRWNLQQGLAWDQPGSQGAQQQRALTRRAAL
jgi:hypothetical protein